MGLMLMTRMRRAKESEYALGDLIGWLLLGFGVVLILNGWTLHFRALPQAGDGLVTGFGKAVLSVASFAELMGGATLVVLGFGLARRYVLGPWLSYVLLLLLAGIALVSLMRGDGAPLVALTVWAAIVIYYHGQRTLFRPLTQKGTR
jgi:hypothetical protein